MLRIEGAARLLTHCRFRTLSVSQLAGEMGENHEKTLELVRELERRRLLVRNVQKLGKGRPCHMLHTTSLGEEFIEQYDALLNLRLYSDANDVRRAIHQARLTQRLEEHHVPVYARFQELNELARNIASSAQTGKSPR